MNKHANHTVHGRPATQSVPAIVSAAWLLANRKDPTVQVIDATWHLAAQNRNAKAEFEEGHIPGSLYADLDSVCDPRPGPPNRMLPSAEFFAGRMAELGVRPNAHLIVYDGVGLYSAARLWWMLRVFGHDRVSVLDGGLPAWTRAGGPLQTGPGAPAARTTWPVRAEPDGVVRTWEQVLDNISTAREQLVDVRPPAMFDGDTSNLYPGVRPGHIPRSVNLPQRSLLREDGTFKDPDEIRAMFHFADVDLRQPIVATCGSGVTACILSLALQIIKVEPCPIYDGSWEEWGMREDLPTERHEARSGGPASAPRQRLHP